MRHNYWLYNQIYNKMDPTTWYCCKYCKNVFSDKSQLLVHKKEQHSIEIKANILRKKRTDIVPVEETFQVDFTNEHMIHHVENESNQDLLNYQENQVNHLQFIEPLYLVQNCDPRNCIDDLDMVTTLPFQTLTNDLENSEIEFISNISTNDVYSVENNNYYAPKETRLKSNDEIEVIYLDSDNDDTNDLNVSTNVSVSSQCDQLNNKVYEDNFTCNQCQSSGLYETVTAAVSNAVDQRSPVIPATLTKVSKPIYIQNLRKQTKVVPQSSQIIKEFLWCPICLLPYTQLSTLKRHLQISHRISNPSKPKKKPSKSGISKWKQFQQSIISNRICSQSNNHNLFNNSFDPNYSHPRNQVESTHLRTALTQEMQIQTQVHSNSTFWHHLTPGH